MQGKRLVSTRKKVIGVSMASVGLVVVIASAAYACTNYVGLMMVKGLNVTTEVTVSGSQAHDLALAMTQSVSAGTAKSDDANLLGSFTVRTASGADANHTLQNGTYHVNWIQIGYSNHTTWLNPSGDCMYWRVPTAATLLGTISITSGVGKKGFTVPDAAVINTGTQESGICISDLPSVDGNQAPLLLV